MNHKNHHTAALSGKKKGWYEPPLSVFPGDTYIDVDLLDLMREFDSAGVDLAVAVTYMNTIARNGAIAMNASLGSVQ